MHSKDAIIPTRKTRNKSGRIRLESSIRHVHMKHFISGRALIWNIYVYV